MSCDFGSYNRRITFQAITEAHTATGAMSKTWANVATAPSVWARIKYLRGEEFSSAAIDREVVSNQLIRFTTHYRSDITPKHRVVFDGKNWDIIEVTEKGYREEIDILAEYSDD